MEVASHGHTPGNRLFRDVEISAATDVVLLLVGGDGVMFNRQISAADLNAVVPRLSPHAEENMVMASGSESNRGPLAAAGCFELSDTTLV